MHSKVFTYNIFAYEAPVESSGFLCAKCTNIARKLSNQWQWIINVWKSRFLNNKQMPKHLVGEISWLSYLRKSSFVRVIPTYPLYKYKITLFDSEPLIYHLTWKRQPCYKWLFIYVTLYVLLSVDHFISSICSGKNSYMAKMMNFPTSYCKMALYLTPVAPFTNMV